MKTIVEIKSKDYWFKVVEMLQQNWALIDKADLPSGCVVYFIHDASGVFDRIQFSSEEKAFRALKSNGFARFSDDNETQKFITPLNHLSSRLSILMDRFTPLGDIGNEM